jgi:hypothetical protein
MGPLRRVDRASDGLLLAVTYESGMTTQNISGYFDARFEKVEKKVLDIAMRSELYVIGGGNQQG